MHTDSLFLQLFRDLPSCFFELVGRPDVDPSTYKVEAVEYKQSALRLDGVFRPVEQHTAPAYIWEAQLYASNKVYGNLVAKMGHYWTQTDPDQELIGVVIYPSESFVQANREPYRKLLDSKLIIPVFLDKLPPPPDDRFDLGILQMIAANQEAALEKARQIVPRVRKAKLQVNEQRMLLQFIQTIMTHQFPNREYEEIEKMIQVTDMTQTRVYQQGVEQGIEQGREQGRKEEQQRMRESIEEIARRLLKLGRPVAEIAKVTGLSAAKIRKLTKE